MRYILTHANEREARANQCHSRITGLQENSFRPSPKKVYKGSTREQHATTTTQVRSALVIIAPLSGVNR